MNFPVIPQLDQCKDAVSLWQQCVGGASVYSVCAEKFLDTLSKVYAGVLSEGVTNTADAGTAMSAHAMPLRCTAHPS